MRNYSVPFLTKKKVVKAEGHNILKKKHAHTKNHYGEQHFLHFFDICLEIY